MITPSPTFDIPNPTLRVPANAKGRDFAVGDIHGCFDKLASALETIGFDHAVDRLFCTGDLVDRGPQSIDALAWLEEPWLFSVSGNHEFLAWRAAIGQPYPHVDHHAVGGEWLAQTSDDERQRVGEAFQRLPAVIEIQTSLGPIGIVHADFPYDDWNELGKILWTQSDHFHGAFDLCLWSTERIERRYNAPIKNVRAVVHGHYVVESHTVLGNVHFIDTGGWLGPQRSFTILDLNTLMPATLP